VIFFQAAICASFHKSGVIEICAKYGAKGLKSHIVPNAEYWLKALFSFICIGVSNVLYRPEGSPWEILPELSNALNFNNSAERFSCGI